MDESLELPHFDIDATVVKRLGEELISDEVSAIMELVKNSYDADADWVKITISTEGQVPEGIGVRRHSRLHHAGRQRRWHDLPGDSLKVVGYFSIE